MSHGTDDKHRLFRRAMMAIVGMVFDFCCECAQAAEPLLPLVSNKIRRLAQASNTKVEVISFATQQNVRRFAVRCGAARTKIVGNVKRLEVGRFFDILSR
jgi:hypothetical protein